MSCSPMLSVMCLQLTNSEALYELLTNVICHMCLQLTNSEALNELFTNVTWSDAAAYLNVNEKEIMMRWAGPTNNIFLTLICFIVIRVTYPLSIVLQPNKSHQNVYSLDSYADVISLLVNNS